MKTLLFLSVSVIAIFCPRNSASQGIQNALNTVKITQSKPVYISTYTSFKKKDGEMGLKTEVSKLNTVYFEIDLMSVSADNTNRAEKEVEPLTSLETLHSVSIRITNKESDPILFNNSTDFLNFMDTRGYEMKDQQKRRFGISYTFKKK